MMSFWISDQYDFNYFITTDWPLAPSLVLTKFAECFARRCGKKIFQDDRCGSHLVFLIGTILAILDLEVILLLQYK